VTLVLSNADVKSLLDPRVVLEVLEESYMQLARGDAACRPHSAMQIPTADPAKVYQWGSTEGGSAAGYFAIRMMSEIRYQSERGGIRTQEKYCVEPGVFCGLVLLFSVVTGEPLAILNDGVLQQMRVGADAAIGAKHMARDDAEVIGVFGAGNLARTIVAALREVRHITKIQVYDPFLPISERYAKDMSESHQIDTVILGDPRDVYAGADILAECTNSAEKTVVQGRYVEPGTHIVSVGRRLDDDAVRKIDWALRLGNATPLAGQPPVTDEHLVYITPAVSERSRQQGHSRGFERNFDDAKVIYLSELLEGRIGRRNRAEITYSERGNIMGAQFHAMAGRVYELAKERGEGREIPTGWLLQDVRN
jgi:alanine dehydrogenase